MKPIFTRLILPSAAVKRVSLYHSAPPPEYKEESDFFSEKEVDTPSFTILLLLCLTLAAVSAILLFRSHFSYFKLFSICIITAFTMYIVQVLSFLWIEIIVSLMIPCASLLLWGGIFCPKRQFTKDPRTIQSQVRLRYCRNPHQDLELWPPQLCLEGARIR